MTVPGAEALAVAVVFLPLIAAVIAGFFGRVIGDRGAQLVTCGALLLSAVLGCFLFRDILASDEVRVIPLANWTDPTTHALPSGNWAEDQISYPFPRVAVAVRSEMVQEPPRR